MEFQISQDGKVVGTFDFDQVLAGIQDGTFVDTDHYWCQGMDGWQTIAHFKQTRVSSQKPVVPSRFKAFQRGAPSAARARPEAKGGAPLHLIGSASGVLMVVGTITPFIHVGLFSPSLMGMSEERAWGLLAAGVISLGLASLRCFKLLVAVGLLSLGVLVELAYRIYSRLPVSMPEAPEASRTLSSAVREAVGASISIEYGAVLLILGVVGVLYAGFAGLDGE